MKYFARDDAKTGIAGTPYSSRVSSPPARSFASKPGAAPDPAAARSALAADETADSAQSAALEYVEAEAAEIPSGAESRAAPADLFAPSMAVVSSRSIRRAVLLLALPVLGEQVLNTFVAWNDTYLAGHIDVSATAAVGFSAYISWLIGMLFGLVGAGASAIVARSIGARDERQARHATNQAVLLAFGMGLLATVGVPLAAPWLTHWFNQAPATREAAVRFMTIESRAYLIEAFTFIAAACLRGAGDTRTPMYVLGVVNLVNMTASWFCAFRTTAPAWLAGAGIANIGLGLGSDGIAWGTFTARVAGGLIMCAVMLRGRAGLWLTLPAMRPDPAAIRRILRIGAPAAADGALIWTGQMVFLGIVAMTGGAGPSDLLLAAHVVGIRIESLSYLPAWAWATAAATLVGQSLGARQADRGRRCANEAVRQTVLVLSCLGALYFVLAESFYRFLTRDPAVIATGVPALRGLALVQPALAVLIIYIGALRGAGDTAFPMLFTIVGMLVVRIPLAYLGGVVMHGGLVGAWVGMYADLVVRALLMAARFRSGRWAHVRV